MLEFVLIIYDDNEREHKESDVRCTSIDIHCADMIVDENLT